MSIRTGDQAASFSLPAAPGEPIDVGAHIGRDRVVLLFFPLAFSSVCTDEMCRMRDDWSAWSRLDAKVFGICIDSPFVTAKFRAELDLPFPILSDFNREVARTYDALHDDLHGLKDVTKRAVFVIDETGQVVYDWVSDDPGAMPDLAAVREAVGASL
ncbi:MAG: redoxin domain-containing protein [Phycisphaerales bacterium]|nr:redoxin domain-containing protein [Phycisphaerae bacterium]NNF43924.1 redoxin domain-containing protein [Phycisphaerales bacterium]NNM27123.1 redoxin domain-containing protein [Phycisphaerales bacterium]